MAKRPDKHDATMEVSSSQLVPGAPKPPPRRPPVGAQNDMSMWAGSVVGGDQFTPAPIPAKSGGSGRWILAIVAILALAGGGYALYRFVLVGDPAPKTAAPAVDSPVDAMPLIADAPIIIDAPAPDAAPDAAVPDAGIEPTIAPKPAVKASVKAPVKKKVVKKKKKKPVKKPVRKRR